MRSARLTLGLASGVFDVAGAGTIAVLHPAPGDDLSDLPRERVLVITPMATDHAAFAAQGYRVAVGPDAGGPWDAAVVCLPRARALGRALVALADAQTRPGGPIAVDGQKDDGVDSMLKELRARLGGAGLSDALSKAHGKMAVFAAGAGLSDWMGQDGQVGDFVTRPGVFSADGVDPGSALLADALPRDLSGKVADFGAGWGYLSRRVLACPGVKELHLVEADATALACAQRNVTDPRAVFHWADATRLRLPRLMDAVVMNPPFHSGRNADPGLGLAFIRAGHAALGQSGGLWLVANRHLPYRPLIDTLFRQVEELGNNPAFRIIHARGPIRRP